MDRESPLRDENLQDRSAFRDEMAVPAHEVALADIAIELDARVARIGDRYGAILRRHRRRLAA